MNQVFTFAFTTLALLAASTVSFAHDDRLHGPNALTGEILSANADGLQLKTKTGTVNVKYSSKTKFEQDKKDVDKTRVRTRDRAGVIGSKLPTGDVMANQVILGLPAPRQSEGAKEAPPKD